MNCFMCGTEMKRLEHYVDVSEDPRYAFVCPKCKYIDYVSVKDFEKI